MTAKEQLLLEVQGLTNDEADAVREYIAYLRHIEYAKHERLDTPRRLSFAGIGHGPGDLAARSEEILRAEFGSS